MAISRLAMSNNQTVDGDEKKVDIHRRSPQPADFQLVPCGSLI